jgi:hypothetical protein
MAHDAQHVVQRAHFTKTKIQLVAALSLRLAKKNNNVTISMPCSVKKRIPAYRAGILSVKKVVKKID